MKQGGLETSSESHIPAKPKVDHLVYVNKLLLFLLKIFGFPLDFFRFFHEEEEKRKEKGFYNFCYCFFLPFFLNLPGSVVNKKITKQPKTA